MRSGLRKALFPALLLFCLTPLATPPLALALGLALALTAGNPWQHRSGKAVKYLLQLSVVGLGFGLNFWDVMNTGRTGLAFTAVSIAGTLAAGWLLGRLFRVEATTSRLISAGTAICGGSAIAALAPVLRAGEKETTIALGTVFLLNSAAIFIFPPLGHYFGLSQSQFGLWAALAIHDTSSVVGAAARYGPEALGIAATVKLTRALWIIPLSLVAAWLFGGTSKSGPPYFILAFAAASLLASALPQFGAVYAALTGAARTGLTVTLFLIGAGLSREAMKAAGSRPVMQGTALWALVSAAALAAIKA